MGKTVSVSLRSPDSVIGSISATKRVFKELTEPIAARRYWGTQLSLLKWPLLLQLPGERHAKASQ